MGFVKATRTKQKARILIEGPTKGGKSVTAIRLAQGFAKRYGGRIAVICSERGRAKLNVGIDFGDGTVDFDCLELSSFSPADYTAAIEEAGRLGYTILVVDGLTQEWQGVDSVLEMVDRAKGASGWKDATPLHRKFIDTILYSPCHVIATVRSKMDVVFETIDGKSQPVRVGVKPVARDDLPYEFDFNLACDHANLCRVIGTRDRSLIGYMKHQPGADLAARIIDWLETGIGTQDVHAIAPGISDQQTAAVGRLLSVLGWMLEKVEKDFPKKYQCERLTQLTSEQAAQVVAGLEARAEAAAKRRKPETAAATTTAQTPTPAALAVATPPKVAPTPVVTSSASPPVAAPPAVKPVPSTNGSPAPATGASPSPAAVSYVQPGEVTAAQIAECSALISRLLAAGVDRAEVARIIGVHVHAYPLAQRFRDLNTAQAAEALFAIRQDVEVREKTADRPPTQTAASPPQAQAKAKGGVEQAAAPAAAVGVR